MEYAVVIEKAADGSYSAYVPDLPGCAASGDTEDEVQTSIAEAIDLHLESLRYHRENVPAPTTRVVAVVVGDRHVNDPVAPVSKSQEAPPADEYVSCPDLHDKDAFGARVHGDSMFPKYREGDIVIFSPAATIRNGDDCFVRFSDGQTTFKRVFFETDTDGRSVVRLQPRNEKHGPRTVPADEVASLYRAVYRYERVDDQPESPTPRESARVLQPHRLRLSAILLN